MIGAEHTQAVYVTVTRIHGDVTQSLVIRGVSSRGIDRRIVDNNSTRETRRKLIRIVIIAPPSSKSTIYRRQWAQFTGPNKRRYVVHVTLKEALLC